MEERRRVGHSGESWRERQRRSLHAIAPALRPLAADELRLGNLDARRDWGFAGDYVRAMWLMLQADEAVDYVVGTGTMHSVQDFVDAAFGHAGLDPEGHVVVDPALLRPAEVDKLVADPTLAREQLGWTPETSFAELVAMMVDADVARLEGTTVGLARSPLA